MEIGHRYRPDSRQAETLASDTLDSHFTPSIYVGALQRKGEKLDIYPIRGPDTDAIGLHDGRTDVLGYYAIAKLVSVK